MTKAQMRKAVREVEPRLNRNAIDRLIGSMAWLSISTKKPVPATVEEVKQFTREYLEDAKKDRMGHPMLQRFDTVDLINDSADELAFEARVS